MGMSKIIKVIVSLALVVFLALAATKTEAKLMPPQWLKYEPIKIGDHSFGCDKEKHPKSCKPEQANPYHRGCHPSQRCRLDQTK
ncbi:unnamed protein product [Eruca vesicaria subsp. sativa]|uniref:Rapid ALkalinization Factor n=1 Tax=Eruca vesicaria subsp. sativa TaxID=29727 RepID=A0ABC8J723_ERUVS|nr:unnamed protein product [Eruca vesicaria subsp. sativa]